MKPVKFEQSNCTIGGEVPAHRARGMVLTRWAGGWRERIKFLLFGKLWLMVQGETMPPTLVTSDRAFWIVNPPKVEVEAKADGEQDLFLERRAGFEAQRVRVDAKLAKARGED